MSGLSPSSVSFKPADYLAILFKHKLGVEQGLSISVSTKLFKCHTSVTILSGKDAGGVAQSRETVCCIRYVTGPDYKIGVDPGMS